MVQLRAGPNLAGDFAFTASPVQVSYVNSLQDDSSDPIRRSGSYAWYSSISSAPVRAISISKTSPIRRPPRCYMVRLRAGPNLAVDFAFTAGPLQDDSPTLFTCPVRSFCAAAMGLLKRRLQVSSPRPHLPLGLSRDTTWLRVRTSDLVFARFVRPGAAHRATLNGKTHPFFSNLALPGATVPLSPEGRLILCLAVLPVRLIVDAMHTLMSTTLSDDTSLCPTYACTQCSFAISSNGYPPSNQNPPQRLHASSLGCHCQVSLNLEDRFVLAELGLLDFHDQQDAVFVQRARSLGNDEVWYSDALHPTLSWLAIGINRIHRHVRVVLSSIGLHFTVVRRYRTSGPALLKLCLAPNRSNAPVTVAPRKTSHHAAHSVQQALSCADTSATPSPLASSSTQDPGAFLDNLGWIYPDLIHIESDVAPCLRLPYDMNAFYDKEYHKNIGMMLQRLVPSEHPPPRLAERVQEELNIPPESG
ncbi:hypothetical protein V8E55_001342 [Tylopilus felleus]